MEIQVYPQTFYDNSIMTFNHPRWREFVAAMRYHVKPASKHPDNYNISAMILEYMGGFDIEKSIEFFKEYGGENDVTIISETINEYDPNIAW